MTKNRWHSIDADFEVVVAISSVAFWPIVATAALIMGQRRCTALWVSMMQDQKLLTRCWRSFLGGGSDMVTSIFAHADSRWVHYGLTLFHSPQIVQNARPKSLTLCWHSIFGGDSDIISSIFANKGGQYIEYGLTPMHSALSVHNARLKIVDTLLTLIFRRW